MLTLQASLVLAVAAVYDELDSPDLRQDLVLILGGNSTVMALRTFGVAAANDMCKKSVQKNVTRETMKKVNKVVSRKILTKDGENSLTSFVRLVPGRGGGLRVHRRPQLRPPHSAIRQSATTAGVDQRLAGGGSHEGT